MVVGVVSLQGDFEKHEQMLDILQVRHQRVRTPEELFQTDRLLIPGGESSTVGLLMQRFGLAEAIPQYAGAGHPIWGTCMGMIVMARSVKARPNQWTLGLLDVEVERNAFGAQVHSFETEIALAEGPPKVTGVFIRAPIVRSYGPDVVPLAEIDGNVVAVRQGKLLGTSFHPELTDDPGFHQYFLGL